MSDDERPAWERDGDCSECGRPLAPMLEDDEPSREDLLDAIEEANDLLADVMRDGNTYTGHDEVRPSAVRGFDRAQEAHTRLVEVDPTRTSPDE